jgi:hypothetical protein
MTDSSQPVIRTSNEHSPECKSDTLKKRRATMPELQDHVREAAPDLLRELRDIVGRYERALTEAGWSDSRVKLATFSAREAIAKAGDDVLKAPAVETREGCKPTVESAAHRSAGPGCRCADCSIDGEACPTCYAAWWRDRHPTVHEHAQKAVVKRCPKCNRDVTEGCNYCACPYPQPAAQSEGSVDG